MHGINIIKSIIDCLTTGYWELKKGLLSGKTSQKNRLKLRENMVQSIQDNIVHEEKDLTLLCLSGVSEVEKK